MTLGGATAGVACASLVYLGTYLAGVLVLGTALLLTVLSSRLGRTHKARLGIEEDHAGQRGAANVAANCAVGAIGGALSAFSSHWYGEPGALLTVTAIAAGASDTVASEVGKAFGGRPRSFPSFHEVGPGTPGAVSLLGTFAGAISAAVIAMPAVVMWLISADRLLVIVCACTVGAFVESALATWFERSGTLNNHTLNFINTVTAGTCAVWWIGQ